MPAKAAHSNGRNAIPRPFLKWAGGKGQLLSELLCAAPEKFEAYHEPFVGGGALFYGLKKAGRLDGKRVYLSDANPELIDCYTAIRDDVEAVIEALKRHPHDKDHYYAVRALDPFSLEPAIRAARTIFLNRTGYNGLYRVNSKGGFNVPFGRYSNPVICDEANLRACSKALSGVSLINEDFTGVLERAHKNDFVYFDPPYVPLSETAHFVNYAKGGFTMEDQERLARLFESLDCNGVYTLLSNSDLEWVADRYSVFNKKSVRVGRAINSNPGSRSAISELLISNS